MSLPYFPMFPDDFEADTAHLTLLEDGAYNRLLRLCWRTPGCSIPLDMTWVYRKMRARTDEEKAAVDIVLEEFFTAKKGRFSNARLSKEYTSATEAHEKRKKAGFKGGSAKALKTNETKSSNAVAKPKQPEPEPEPYKTEAKASSKKRGNRLSEDWVLPLDWGQWAIDQGWPEPAIRDQAERFKDYFLSAPGQKGVKLDWLATWRNWMRNSNSPKLINGGKPHVAPTSKGSERVNAFIAGARGTS